MHPFVRTLGGHVTDDPVLDALDNLLAGDDDPVEQLVHEHSALGVALLRPHSA
jgi:hypothetical protein